MEDSAFPFSYRGGLYLPELGLWLDPRRRSQAAVVSHAHADHARGHESTIATPATLALMQARNVRCGSVTALPFREPLQLRNGEIELFPAGHVLGSAQIRATTGSGRLLYSGDFKVRPGLSCEAAEIPTADVLIMETTFGRPRYRFPPIDDVVAQIRRFCEDALNEGIVPVLMGYSIGKAQEILAALRDTAFTIVVHEAIERIAKVYSVYGQPMPATERLGEVSLRGKVVVLPPNADRSRHLEAGTAVRSAVVSGWGIDSSARYRYRCDEVFVLSDHAGYDELLQYVEQVDARQVYTLHGYAEAFAQDLRSRGIDAWSLISDNQLEFSFS